jgi:hypothetical protein
MTKFENSLGSQREKVWLENSLGQPFSRWLTKIFSNLVIHHLPAHEDGTDREFRNVGIYNSDAEELPNRKRTTEDKIIPNTDNLRYLQFYIGYRYYRTE